MNSLYLILICEPNCLKQILLKNEILCTYSADSITHENSKIISVAKIFLFFKGRKNLNLLPLELFQLKIVKNHPLSINIELKFVSQVCKPHFCAKFQHSLLNYSLTKITKLPNFTEWIYRVF